MKVIYLILVFPLSLFGYEISEWETFREGEGMRRLYSLEGKRFMTEGYLLNDKDSDLGTRFYTISFPHQKAEERLQILITFMEENLDLISSRQHGDDFAFFITRDLNSDGRIDLIDLSADGSVALYLIKDGKISPVEKQDIHMIETHQVEKETFLLELLEKMD